MMLDPRVPFGDPHDSKNDDVPGNGGSSGVREKMIPIEIRNVEIRYVM